MSDELPVNTNIPLIKTPFAQLWEQVQKQEDRLSILEDAAWHAGKWQGSKQSFLQYLNDEMVKRLRKPCPPP